MEINILPHIFHDPSVKACFPTDIKFEEPTVIYSLTNGIMSKIFNFVKFVSNLDVAAFLQDNTILPCNCAGCGQQPPTYSDWGIMDLWKQ